MKNAAGFSRTARHQRRERPQPLERSLMRASSSAFDSLIHLALGELALASVGSSSRSAQHAVLGLAQSSHADALHGINDAATRVLGDLPCGFNVMGSHLRCAVARREHPVRREARECPCARRLRPLLAHRPRARRVHTRR
jgi:hypothetical protein